MTKHTAKIRSALTNDGRLVPDTHPDAALLFAGIGAEKSAEELAAYPNAGEFFTGFFTPVAVEVKTSPTVRVEDTAQTRVEPPVETIKSRKPKIRR